MQTLRSRSSRIRLGAAAGAGFTAGLMLAAAFMILNPLVTPATLATAITSLDAAGRRLETFFIQAPDDIVVVTHNGRNIIDPRPAGIGLFAEPAINSGLLLVAKIRNARGEIVGIASESEVLDASSNPLLGRMRMNTDWTILLPARGTLFVTQIEEAGAAGKAILPTVMLGGEWSGDARFVSTSGPATDGRGLIVGGTREFAGATGSFVESSHLTRFSQAQGGVGAIELQLAVALPADQLVSGGVR